MENLAKLNDVSPEFFQLSLFLHSQAFGDRSTEKIFSKSSVKLLELCCKIFGAT
jgi:hypothetical protein